MTDHADTIRRYLQGHTTNVFPELLEAVEALDALVAERQQAAKEADQLRLGLQATQELLDARSAERQQAIDERDAAQKDADFRERGLHEALRKETARCEQAIDALREIDALMPGTHCGDIARAALLNLGEKP